MKNSAFLNSPPLLAEIGQVSLRLQLESQSAELPLERQPDGRLTAACKERTIAALKDFVKAKSWQSRARALCAINARGVSLRRLSLPAGTKEEFQQRLLLQIEAEFPLAPDELAWGWQSLGELPSTNGTAAKQELLVAAVKKEVVADYLEIFRASGTEPVFTLAALARKELYTFPPDAFTMMDVGVSQAELTLFENGVPTNSRIVFWNADEARAKLDALVPAMKGSLAGTKLLLSGENVTKDFAAQLRDALGIGWSCEILEPDVAGSAAIAGLKNMAGQGGDPALTIRVAQAGGASASQPSLDLKKWGLRVGALMAAIALLPFAEALLLKRHLANTVAAFKTEAVRLTVIDRELEFLRYLKSSQPPYLDALYIFSKAVPPGTKFDLLSLNSHGQVSLRCVFRDGQQVADFRTKLIASGFFTNVTVEEQTPTPDHQRVSVRISAQEKPLVQLQALSVGPSAEETAKNGKSAPPAAKRPVLAPAGTNAPTTNSPATSAPPKS